MIGLRPFPEKFFLSSAALRNKEVLSYRPCRLHRVVIALRVVLELDNRSRPGASRPHGEQNALPVPAIHGVIVLGHFQDEVLLILKALALDLLRVAATDVQSPEFSVAVL